MQNGETLSEETIEKFTSMSSQDLVNAYIQMVKNTILKQSRTSSRNV